MRRQTLKEIPKVEVPWSVIRNIQLKESKNFREPVTVEDKGVFLKLGFHVVLRHDSHSGLGFYFLSVQVQDLETTGNGFLISGSVTKQMRNWVSADGYSGHLESSTSEISSLHPLSGEGILCELLLGHTKSFSIDATLSVPVDTFAPIPPDLRRLTDLHDVVLDVAGVEIPAHRLVLASGSEVFHRMFASNLKERHQDRVQLLDISSGDAFKKLIEFLYTGKVAFWDDLEVEVLGLADRFLVEPLKVECVETLLALPASRVVAALQASFEKPYFPKSVRASLTSQLLKLWESLTASADWQNFEATHPEAASALDSAHYAIGAIGAHCVCRR